MRLKVLMIPAADGGYTAVVPSLKGCVTQGETFEEALANAREAATGWLRTAADHGFDIPAGDDGMVVAEIEAEAPVAVGA